MGYIVSGKGFLKSIGFNTEKREKEFIWVENVRDATNYSHAKKTIAKQQLDAFAWNPFSEEPIPDKFKIVKHNAFFRKEDDVNDWIVERVVMESKTDSKFLQKKDFKFPEYYSYDEAVKICNQMNNDMYAKLQKQIDEGLKRLIPVY